MLYQLSYTPTMAGAVGLEPTEAAFGERPVPCTTPMAYVLVLCVVEQAGLEPAELVGSPMFSPLGGERWEAGEF